VLLSTPLHASSNFTVSVQLANKRGFTKKNVFSDTRLHAALHGFETWPLSLGEQQTVGAEDNMIE
jgi:hypothetical protein